jgi:hypothetical protein
LCQGPDRVILKHNLGGLQAGCPPRQLAAQGYQAGRPGSGHAQICDVHQGHILAGDRSVHVCSIDMPCGHRAGLICHNRRAIDAPEMGIPDVDDCSRPVDAISADVAKRALLDVAWRQVCI